ncbi:MAG: hypothetical protein GY807_11035 [Gammaproteobacteria bacterium]|nr:hypothetical protein [Gammaproteobacteria bacterium]
MNKLDLRIDSASGSPSCIGAGFIALDIVQGRRGDFAAVGGSCGNVVSILKWLGWCTAPAGRLGADAAGLFVRSEFSDEGVNTEFIELADRVATPIVIQKFVDSKSGDRSHRFSLSCPDCGGWLPRYRPMTIKSAEAVSEAATDPKAFYFDRVSPSCLRLANWAQDRGALVVFEPSSVGDDRAFQKAVDLCHVLKFSHERLGHIPDLANAVAPRIVIETLGEDGIRARWRGRWSSLNAFRAPMFVDAAGSGDWFSAGLIHKLGRSGSAGLADLRKSDLERALRFGSALAAVNCGFEGARGGMLAISKKQFNRAMIALEGDPNPDDFDWKTSDPKKQVVPTELCNTCSTQADDQKKSASGAP